MRPLGPTRNLRSGGASMAFVTDSNRPQLLWQPPPTDCLTTSGAASAVSSLLMHPWEGADRAVRRQPGAHNICSH